MCGRRVQFRDISQTPMHTVYEQSTARVSALSPADPDEREYDHQSPMIMAQPPDSRIYNMKRTPAFKQALSSLRSVMEAVPASVYVVSSDFRLICFNRLFKIEMKQAFDVDIFEGYDFKAFEGVGNVERWTSLFMRVFQGNAVDERWEAVAASVSNILHITGQPIVERGAVTAAAIYIKNLNEEVRLAADYTASLERSKLALEATNSIAFEWVISEGTVRTTNLEGVTGYFAEYGNVSTKWWFELVLDEDRQGYVAAIDTALDGGDSVLFDYRIRGNGGETFEVHMRAVVFRDFEGAPTALVGIVQDISERKRLERQLIEARNTAEEMNRLKSSFLANMSHEIRTPLTAVIGYADLLATALAGSEHGSFADRISQSGKHLLTTINSVLDLAKIEANMLQLKMGEVDLKEKIASVLTDLQPLATNRGLTLTCECPLENPIIITDRNAIRSILVNLVGNAIKFTQNGYVTVSIRHTEWDAQPAFEIEVTDTGIGIADIQRIFLPFVQESEGFGRHYEGTGLGLSITQRLVEALGGIITVLTEIGKGSSFIVTLPLRPIEA